MRPITRGPEHPVTCVCRGSGRAILYPEPGCAFLVNCPGANTHPSLSPPTRASAQRTSALGVSDAGPDFRALLDTYVHMECAVCGRIYGWTPSSPKGAPNVSYFAGICSDTCRSHTEEVRKRHVTAHGQVNPIALELGDYYDKTPKHVFAAVLVHMIRSARREDWLIPEEVINLVWGELHREGILPPPNKDLPS